MNSLFVFCPPLSAYPEQPKDQSKCELIDCPQCKQKMWLSAKKKAMMSLLSREREHKLFCYPCILEYVRKNPDVVDELQQINL